jgi:hypothetical protein
VRHGVLDWGFPLSYLTFAIFTANFLFLATSECHVELRLGFFLSFFLSILSQLYSVISNFLLPANTNLLFAHRLTSDGQAITSVVTVTSLIPPGSVVTSGMDSAGSKSKSNIGAIVGGVVGGMSIFSFHQPNA